MNTFCQGMYNIIKIPYTYNYTYNIIIKISLLILYILQKSKKKNIRDQLIRLVFYF